MKKKGRIFVISAASGSGKTTLCRRLVKERRSIAFSISFTTRRLRKGEKNKRDYIFVSEKQFKEYRRTGKLLEWAKVFTHFYGTPKYFVEKNIQDGKDVILAIDVQGAFKIKKARPDAILIFILPPSLKELQRRLYSRKSENAKQIKERLKTARQEIRQAKKYDYVVVNNDLHEAVGKLKEIVASRRNIEVKKNDYANSNRGAYRKDRK